MDERCAVCLVGFKRRRPFGQPSAIFSGSLKRGVGHALYVQRFRSRQIFCLAQHLHQSHGGDRRGLDICEDAGEAG